MAARIAGARTSPGCAATQRAAGSCGSAYSPWVRLSGLPPVGCDAAGVAGALATEPATEPAAAPVAVSDAASADSSGEAARAMTVAAAADALVRRVTLGLAAIGRKRSPTDFGRPAPEVRKEPDQTRSRCLLPASGEAFGGYRDQAVVPYGRRQLAQQRGYGVVGGGGHAGGHIQGPA